MNVSKVKVSVIIPVYNTEKYLKKCLESIKNQTLQGIELIIVNDGSTDNSQSIIDKFVEEANFPVQCKIKENAGQSAARNDAMQLAKGEYIAFIDSDDYIAPDYFEKLYKAAITHNSEAVTCGCYMIDMEGNMLRKICVSKKNATPYGKPGFNIVWCNLYKRSFLIENHMLFQVGKIYEDVPFSIAVKYQAKNAVAIDYEGYYCVQRIGSTMHSNAVQSSQFPFEKMTECVKNSVQKVEAGGIKVLEYDILHFWAGFLFHFCRKAQSEDLDILVSYAQDMIQKYFPKYYKNPYIYKTRNHLVPFVNQMAVLVFVWANKLGVLRILVGMVTKL